MFKVKEVFLTLQGEGHNAGRRAVFVRFSGCNMWTGRDKDRAKGKAACSRWCDTDFYGGTSMSQDALLFSIKEAWGKHPNGFVVFTGGEPALQLTEEIIVEVRRMGFSAAVETNGSLPLPAGVYWRTISPKTENELACDGNELKLIYPTLPPEMFASLNFDYFYLQPLDDSRREENTARAIDYIKTHPQWRLSLQIHKTLGIP